MIIAVFNMRRPPASLAAKKNAENLDETLESSGGPGQ